MCIVACPPHDPFIVIFELCVLGGEVGGGEQVGSAPGERPAEHSEEEWRGVWRAYRDLAIFPTVL